MLGFYSLVWLGGVLTSPRQSMLRLVHHDSSRVGDVLLLMLLAVPVLAPVEIARAFLSYQGFSAGLLRLFSLYTQIWLGPIAVCVGFAFLLVGMERLKGRRLAFEQVVTAAFFLWVPVIVLGLLGACLRALGLNLWVLPNIPLQDFLAAEPPVWVILLKVPISYGPTAALAWLLAGVVGEGGKPKAEAVRTRAPGLLLAGCLGVSYLLATVSVVGQIEQIMPLQVGDPAPAFRLPRADGAPDNSLASFSGRPVVLHFWATWCPACIESLPGLQAWADSHPELSVVMIHQGGQPQAVAAFLAANKWPSGNYLVDLSGRVSVAYRVDSLPTYFVLNARGIVKAVSVGAPSKSWLQKHLLDQS